MQILAGCRRARRQTKRSWLKRADREQSPSVITVSHRAQPAEPIHGIQSFSDGELTGQLFEAVAEGHLNQPTFIYDFPTDISPLSKQKPDDPSLAERFELFIAGMEIANGFSELNDPADQERRFRAQVEKGGQEAPKEVDIDYIRALSHGLPPTAGEGVGIDRLVMLLTDSHAIREVILFPLLRAETAENRGGSPRKGRRRRRKLEMSFEWLVALRYLRSPNRPAVLRLVTLLAVLGVAAGVMTLVIALAMDTGFRQAIRDRLLSVTAHVNLKPASPEGIHNYREEIAKLSDAPGVRSIEPAVYITVLLSIGNRSRGVVLKGVDPGVGAAHRRRPAAYCGRLRQFCAGSG